MSAGLAARFADEFDARRALRAHMPENGRRIGAEGAISIAFHKPVAMHAHRGKHHIANRARYVPGNGKHGKTTPANGPPIKFIQPPCPAICVGRDAPEPGFHIVAAICCCGFSFVVM